MYSIRCFGHSAMKPSCKFLITRKSSELFGSAKYLHTLSCDLPENYLNSNHRKQFLAYPFSILGFSSINNGSQKSFCLPGVSFGQSRLILGSPYGFFSTAITTMARRLPLIASVASRVKEYSTSVETRVNDKKFERIYVQNGINVKPLIIERIDKDKNIVSEQESRIGVAVADDVESVNKQNLEADKGVEVVSPKKEKSDIDNEAWKLLNDAVVKYCGSSVVTVAANDPGDKLPLNYDQVFIRDFVPSALAFLPRGEGEIVRHFLLHTLRLQSWERIVDCYSPGQGLVPASFKVRTVPLDGNTSEEVLDPDFGESAIGRVAPVDSGLWWIILLRAYGKITSDITRKGGCANRHKTDLKPELN